MIAIPERTTQAVVQEFGDAGREWLDAQPEKLAKLGARWKLTFDEPFETGLPINIVFRVSRGDQRYVLKTGFPHPEMFTEMAMLAHWHRRPGCVQLIDADKEIGAVLMERIVPGTGFRALARPLPESEATSQVQHLFEAIPIRAGATDEFPTYHKWCDRAFSDYRKRHEPDPFLTHIERVEKLVSAVTKHHDEGWLLHGDLHHENILLSETGDYVVVDPKGVIGPRLLEYGRFVHNFYVDRLGEMSAETILKERLSALKGEFSEEQILLAGYVDLVLASSWTLNSGKELKAETLELIELMSALLD